MRRLRVREGPIEPVTIGDRWNFLHKRHISGHYLYGRLPFLLATSVSTGDFRHIPG